MGWARSWTTYGRSLVREIRSFTARDWWFDFQGSDSIVLQNFLRKYMYTIARFQNREHSPSCMSCVTLGHCCHWMFIMSDMWRIFVDGWLQDLIEWLNKWCHTSLHSLFGNKRKGNNKRQEILGEMVTRQIYRGTFPNKCIGHANATHSHWW